MSSADWDEVKRLAADFQKAQLSFALQKLSERNCIEIIMKLTENKLLDVIFTNDGKEYVTPQHLSKEIKDELYIHGGRINLIDLAKVLNVDLSQVLKAAGDIERHEKNIQIILGKLIDQNYTMKISEEINDKLNQIGYINVSELSLHYDLPAEFLRTVIEKGLGKTISGKQDTQDPRVFYNQSFIARNEAKVRGALSAITKPTPLSAILGQCSVPERLFFSIVENLQEIPGVVTGKHSSNGIYVPTIYSKNQSDWVNNFYKQNGYLEYDALVRLGISDPRNFVKRHFPRENLILLNTVAVGSALIDQVEANIEEIISNNSYSDLYLVLPTVFSPEDVETLLREVTSKMKSTVHIFAKTIIASDTFLQNLYKKLESVAEKKGAEIVDNGIWLQTIAENKLKTQKSLETNDFKVDKKAERRKKASSGKAGGGSQGRETKTKSTKKKYYNKNQDNDSDNEQSSQMNSKTDMEFLTVDSLKKELMQDESLSELEEFVDELVDHYYLLLNKHVFNVAEQLSQKHKTNLGELEVRLNNLVPKIRIFDKGIKCLDKNEQEALSKYLLKTLGVDFTTNIFQIAAHQNVTQCPNNLTTEVRQKMLNDFPADVRKPLNDLHKSLVGNNVEEFLNSIEPAMTACSIVLKKFDKKKEKVLVSEHRESLLELLNNTPDPSLSLHLVTAILFTAATQNALHISGRHVTVILSFLQPFLQESTVSVLSEYHGLVIDFFRSSDGPDKNEVEIKLNEKLENLKNIARDYKKQLKMEKTAN